MKFLCKKDQNEYRLSLFAVAGAVHDGDVLHHAVPHVRGARHRRRPRIRLQGSGQSDLLTVLKIRQKLCMHTKVANPWSPHLY